MQVLARNCFQTDEGQLGFIGKDRHSYHRPIQTNCGPTLAAIPLAMWSHAAVSWEAHCVHDGLMHATCPMYEIGPCEFLHAIAFRLMRANLGSSARTGIYIMGQYELIVGQPFFFFFELQFIVLSRLATRHVLSTLCVSSRTV